MYAEEDSSPTTPSEIYSRAYDCAELDRNTQVIIPAAASRAADRDVLQYESQGSNFKFGISLPAAHAHVGRLSSWK